MAGQRLNLTPIGAVCGKRRFYDQVDAQEFASCLGETNLITGRGKPGELVVYWCARCEAVHVGHKRWAP
jgi:hypothetical protein